MDMIVYIRQNVPEISVIEVMAENYYGRSRQEKKVAFQVSRAFIRRIEKIVERCEGNFLSVDPQLKPSRKCKMALNMTIQFKSDSSIEMFKQILTASY